MNYSKDITKFVFLISTLIIISLVSYYFLLSNNYKKEQSKIKIPDITNITSIHLQNLKQEQSITNKVEITKVVNIINTSKHTQKQSINDYPTNASKVITMTIIGKENNTTIYLYRQNDNYYLEQPVNSLGKCLKNF